MRVLQKPSQGFRSTGALWPSSGVIQTKLHFHHVIVKFFYDQACAGCSRKLSCPFHRVSSVSVLWLSEVREVCWVPGAPKVSPCHREAPPPLSLLPRGPHTPSGKPLRTQPMVTHTQAPHLGRSPASPDVGDEGLDVPRQHGDHIGDDEGGRGPADQQSGHESHAGHAAQHRRRLSRPWHRQLGGSALESRRGSGDSRGASALPPRLSPPGAPGMPRRALASLHFRFCAALPAPDGGGEPRTAVGPFASHRCRHLKRFGKFVTAESLPTARVPVAAGSPGRTRPVGAGRRAVRCCRGVLAGVCGSCRRLVPSQLSLKELKMGSRVNVQGLFATRRPGGQPWRQGNRVRHCAGPITESCTHLIRLGLSFQTHSVALICKSSLRFTFPHA